MLYQIEVAMRTNLPDPIGNGVKHDILDLNIKGIKDVRFVQIYIIEGNLTPDAVETITQKVLADPVVNRYSTNGPLEFFGSKSDSVITVFLKPGVMDPVESSTLKAIHDLGYKVNSVRTGRKYHLKGRLSKKDLAVISRKILANETIEEIFAGHKKMESIVTPPPYSFKLVNVPILTMSVEELVKLSSDLHLSLDETEMTTIKDYYVRLRRNPTEIELETIAQTWSEHCKHKTLMGRIEYTESIYHGMSRKETIDNLLKQTVMKVTNELNKPWCISVFKDNAGIIEFDKNNAVCFKVETHNHPSAIEPYGGAGTGIGGVIRDCLGCGLGAKPIMNTDVFCFAPPDFPHRKLPAGVLHPKRVMKGVVRGVRDYGNRMGIPTSNGALYFDNRYLGNPLVYCGTIGIMPRTKCFKHSDAGDLVLLVGGRTGRDGIHGVTFASLELTDKSEMISSGAVQIGNAITEKKVLDTVLKARDLGLYSAITDCGGGGLSSAIGEMGSELGVTVDLEKVPLKYQGLSPTEIWISEAQERMVMSVPPRHKDAILKLFTEEDVEATFIGQFTGDKQLILKYKGNEVGNLAMDFLHDGLPRFFRQAEWKQPHYPEPKLPRKPNLGKSLKQILGMWNVCSKEWVIRQYDHEVQAMSALKPLVGAANDGPGDACVLRPLVSHIDRRDANAYRGLVVANGMSPTLGDIDPYHMAASSIDEALRNIVAVGGDIRHTALLDNFCWGNTNKPENLGSLVRATRACYDMALVFETPFVSGKDSLNNEFRLTKDKSIVIPPSLLISAISVIPDVRKTTSMYLKGINNLIYIVGRTKSELGGSHYYELLGARGNNVPKVEPLVSKKIMLSLSEAIRQGFVAACHDLSEGGLGVAVAEMAFAGDIGAEINLSKVPLSKNEMINRDDLILFSESNSRFIVEVAPASQTNFERLMIDCPCALIGRTIKDKKLKVIGLNGKQVLNEALKGLKSAWQDTLQ